MFPRRAECDQGLASALLTLFPQIATFLPSRFG